MSWGNGRYLNSGYMGNSSALQTVTQFHNAHDSETVDFASD